MCKVFENYKTMRLSAKLNIKNKKAVCIHRQKKEFEISTVFH